MGRMKLELQFKRAAEMRFREHIDKHALKLEGRLTDCAYVFSYSVLYNLLAFSDNFCNWMRENGRGYKYIREIPVEVWNDFLEAKASEKVGLITLKNYRSRLNT